MVEGEGTYQDQHEASSGKLTSLCSLSMVERAARSSSLSCPFSSTAENETIKVTVEPGVGVNLKPKP